MDGDAGAVVVTGGAGAIGTATVRAYGRRGIRVVVVDRAPLDTREAWSGPAPLEHVRADVTNADDIARARAEVEALGWDVRHLVSVAGRAMDPEFGALTDTSEATIRDSLELNLTSHILLTRAFLPMLGARPSDTPMLGARPSDTPMLGARPSDTPMLGARPSDTTAGDRSITLVSSINALRDYGLPAYSAAKAGMFGFARAMSTELGALGVRINVVVPGTVMTGSTETQPKDFERLRRGTALNRLAVPDDIAAAVVAASHELRAMTGQLLVIDCGQTVATPAWRLDSDARVEVMQP